MKERKPEIQGGRVSRKHFLKIAAAGAGVALVGYEAFKAKEGVVTPRGIFVPLYKAHEIGIRPEQIPKGLDVYFSECVTGELLFKLTPQKMLQEVGTQGAELFPEPILNDLAQKKAEIMLGDVSPPGFMTILGPLKTWVKEIQIYLAECSVGLGMSSIALKLKGQEKASKNITRRQFCRGAASIAAGIGLWGASPASSAAASMAVEYFTRIMDGAPGQHQWLQQAIKRPFFRTHGVQSHFHPEMPTIFFRNLMMADKLLCVGEEIKQKTGRRFKIAFEIGAAHTGIEDLLQAGPNICRALVLAHPSSFLRQWVEANNGPEDFCSARLFKLPEDFPIAGEEKWEQITERRVTDQKLFQALKKRL